MDARCLRCGDLITPDGKIFRCVGCDLYCDQRGRKLPRQPTKAEKLRRYRERQLVLDIGKQFGAVTYVRQTAAPGTISAAKFPPVPPERSRLWCLTCDHKTVMRRGKIICPECGEIKTK